MLQCGAWWEPTHRCHSVENALLCVAVRCSVLQCVVMCCSVLQCIAVCCRVLLCVTVCCSVLQQFMEHIHGCHPIAKGLQFVAMCCSVVQCVAVWCMVLPCVAVCCSVLHQFREHIHRRHCHHLKQSGDDAFDSPSYRSFPAKQPLIMGLFYGKDL